MPDLLFFLAMGHFVGDFVLQSDHVAQTKRSSLEILTFHVLVYTLTIAVFLFWGLSDRADSHFFRITTLIVLVALFAGHWVQDFVRSRWFTKGKQSLYVDQFLHLAILFALRLYVYNS